MSKFGHTPKGCTALPYTPGRGSRGYTNFSAPRKSPPIRRYANLRFGSWWIIAQLFKECATPLQFCNSVRYPNFGYHSLSDSLAFLRWRRLISPLAAVTKNPAVLSPSSRSCSISSITSWGMRMVVICDFAFFAPVAITETPCVRCISVYVKKIRRKVLRCISLWARFKRGGDIHLESAKPGSVPPLTGPLTTKR
jgi:hypothetical protein